MENKNNFFTEDQIKVGNEIISKFMGEETNAYHESLTLLRDVISKVLSIESSEFEGARFLMHGWDEVKNNISQIPIHKENIDFWNGCLVAITWYNNAKGSHSAIAKLKEETGTSVPKEYWGSHETHCCKRHGCKYGDHDNCPVTLGLVKQAYSCETGSEFNEDCFEESSEKEEIFSQYEDQTENPTYDGFKKWFMSRD